MATGLRTAALLMVTGALLAGLAAPAAAQFPAELAAGARVQVMVPDSVRQEPLWPRQQTLIGTVARVGGDTLYLVLPSTTGEVAVPRSSIRTLAVSRGVPSRAESALRHGARVALTGAATFFLMRQADADGPYRSPGEAAAIGGAIGFGIGAILGAISPSERWRTLRLRR